jgi:hypothetical protein
MAVRGSPLVVRLSNSLEITIPVGSNNASTTFTVPNNQNSAPLPAVSIETAIHQAIGTTGNFEALTPTGTVTNTVRFVDDLFTDISEAVTTPEDTPISGNVIDAGLTSGDGPIRLTTFKVDINNNGTLEIFNPGQTATIAGIGLITISSNGDYIFTPVANFNGTVPTVTYSLTDDAGVTVGDTSMLAITVTAVDDPFTDDNEITSTPKDTVKTGNVIDAELTSVDGPITVSGFIVEGIFDINNQIPTFTAGETVAIAGIGTIKIELDGTYVFTPATNWNGTVPTITYSLTDTFGIEEVSTLDIIVNGAPDEKPPLPRKDVFGHHYFQRRFEEKPIEMGRYEFNEIVLDFNGDQGGINQFRPPMADTTGTRDALDYSNVTPYNKFDRVADEIEIAKRSLDLGLAILKLPDYELRNILPLADVKVPANGNVEYRLPAATFKGGKGDLKLVAVLKDGSPLPGWLKFNPKTGLFEGVVPPDHVGPIDLKVIATDDVGGQADVKLTIKPEATKAVLKGKPSFTAQLKSAIGLGQ